MNNKIIETNSKKYLSNSPFKKIEKIFEEAQIFHNLILEDNSFKDIEPSISMDNFSVAFEFNKKVSVIFFSMGILILFNDKSFWKKCLKSAFEIVCEYRKNLKNS